MKSDADVPTILQMDGVSSMCLDKANQEIVSIEAIINSYGTDKSWSHTVINSPSNSSTLICQMPGEGNRRHHHPDWDEWWYIVDGEWEWHIEGEIKKVKKGDIVFIERNRKHQIKASGTKAAIRLAVSRYDVAHEYDEKDYSKSNL